MATAIEAEIDRLIGAGHGPFPVDCPDDCPDCLAVCALIDEQFRAAMKEAGIELVDIRTLPPDERERLSREAERDALADEHRAAADYSDPCERMFDENGDEL